MAMPMAGRTVRLRQVRAVRPGDDGTDEDIPSFTPIPASIPSARPPLPVVE